MTEIEPARQGDMFSGDWVDNRNAAQRRKDRQSVLPQSIEMFSPHDVIYQRVNPRPQMPIPDHIAIPYMWTDPRTPEEIEAAREAGRSNLGGGLAGPKVPVGGQTNRKNYAASTGSAAKTGI